MPLPTTALAPKFPLHHAIQDKSLSEGDIMRILRNAFANDPACIGRPDNNGLRLISVAIAAANVTAINTLLELAATGMAAGEDPLGLLVPDSAQETPVSHNVRLLRESPRFVIHDLLDGATENITKAYIQHKMPACTCGKCAGCWLSPRMRFRLRETAHDVYVAMGPKLDSFFDGQPLDSTTILEDTPLQFIPISILQFGVYKPFYVGYRSAFHAIRDLLGDPSAVPTVPILRQELAQGARGGKYDRTSVEYFLERGGSIKYALDMTVHLAACLSRTPLGDGSFDVKWDEPLPPLGSPGAPAASPRLSSPQSGSPRLLGSPETDPGIKRRRRSSSVRDILGSFGKKEKKSWLSDIQQTAEAAENRERQARFKAEWDASGLPGCPLDTQFVGVRYLMGLHSAPRWDVDAQDAWGRDDCQLKRM
ncbi:hypothetical protein PsYK624_156000 [Phanerochaete sordida]|uniref:Uncharacterized protein n=1 Tax=Phanerochaete sordida TaxID=48140 RepID=A0A9P3GR64_9APHY|nr:hypothetical protein PsYK624_156000 [Phanerochaete sordida]